MHKRIDVQKEQAISLANRIKMKKQLVNNHSKTRTQSTISDSKATSIPKTKYIPSRLQFRSFTFLKLNLN